MHSEQLVSKEVQRAKDLIRLSVDPGAAENESRNAALQACRLIVKHGLLIVAQAPSEPYRAPPSPPRQPPRPAPSADVPRGGRVIRSRYETTCKVCDGLIEIGDSIWWVKGEGSAHVECVA